MTTLTRRTRRIAVALAGVAAAFALTVPAAAAHAATGSYTPNPHEWYFSNWHIQQEVWPVTQGSGVTVGLVDSGTRSSLPDLQGVVKPGADMLGSGNGETDYESNGGHGTEMAELISGQGIGGGQFGSAPVGIAPQVKILPVHAIDPSNGTAPIAKGIKYAVDHGAQVINMSIGATAPSATTCDPSVQQAVAYALSRNVVVVAASGDIDKGDTVPQQPATCAGVLAVGGVEPDGSLWKYSTQGQNVSVAAPGDHLYVTSDTGEQYSVDTHGTSGASALVSGAAALIRSKYPSMPWYKVDQRLIGTAIATGPVPNNGTGYGIIDVSKALNVSKYPVSSSSPNPPYTRYQAWLKSTGQSGSTGTGSQASPSKGGSGTLILLIGIVVVVLIIAAVLIIVLVSRGKRRGPRSPGGGYPPNAYPPQPGQYQQPGQYPRPGPYAPPGQPRPPAPPPGQYPPPGQQYPPPRQ